MFRFFGFLFIIMSLSSCATIMNTNYCTVKVDSTTDSVKITIPETNQEYNTPAVIALRRSRDDVQMIVSDDSIAKEIILESHLSPAFTVGNLFGAGLYGYIIDLTNKRRYTYPRKVTIDLYADEPNIRPTLFSRQKGQINLDLTMPFINQMYITRGNEKLQSAGFAGFAAGMDFYHSSREYFSFQMGIAYSNFEYHSTNSGDLVKFQSAYTRYINLSENFCFNKSWQAGAGISLSRMVFTEVRELPTEQLIMDLTNRGYGLTLSGGYNFSGNLFAKVHYQPVFIMYEGTNYFDYQHTLSLEITWKLKIVETKQK